MSHDEPMDTAAAMVEVALSPLAAAAVAKREAETQYAALGALDAGLKQRERHLDNAIRAAQHVQRLARTVADAQRCRAEEEQLRDERAVIIGERTEVLVQSQEVSHALITATGQYREVEDQARAALRLVRLRQAEAREAQAALAAVIGAEEAAALAANPTLRPDWMKG
jgi:hypothetical protein